MDTRASRKLGFELVLKLRRPNTECLEQRARKTFGLPEQRQQKVFGGNF